MLASITITAWPWLARIQLLILGCTPGASSCKNCVSDAGAYFWFVPCSCSTLSFKVFILSSACQFSVKAGQVGSVFIYVSTEAGENINQWVKDVTAGPPHPHIITCHILQICGAGGTVPPSGWETLFHSGKLRGLRFYLQWTIGKNDDMYMCDCPRSNCLLALQMCCHLLGEFWSSKSCSRCQQF